MTDMTVAVVIHVLSVLWWIGGVAFVTTVVLPHVRKCSPEDAVAAFDTFEHRFKPQARIAVSLVGLSGLYMVARMDLWSRFLELRFWWLDAMTLYWALFMLLLFAPNHAGLLDDAPEPDTSPDVNWPKIQRMHWILLALALVIIAGGLATNYRG